MMRKILLFTTCFIFFVSSLSAQIIYVKQGASGSNNGTNWLNAYINLQSALVGATSGDIIWVAKGTYKSTSGSDRTISFVIPAGVEVYGGFFGNESSMNPRDFITNETILSGNINGLLDSTDNSYHVIYTTEAGTNTIVDGFTIQDGVANGSVGFDIGGGWYNHSSNTAITSPKIANCIFKNNFAFNGGGIYHSSSFGTCSPVYTNVSFINNAAGTSGGAVFHSGGAPPATNLPVFNGCSFTGNSASNGGAIYTNDAVSIEYNNCSFTLNQSTLGGAIYNSIYAPDIYQSYLNCTFINNKALSLGGAVFVSCAEVGNTQTFSGCEFTGDSAQTSGGAIYMSTNSTGILKPQIINTTFSQNDASAGGAIYFVNAGDSIKTRIENSIFDSNGNDHLGFNSKCGIMADVFNSTFYGAATQALNFTFWNSCPTDAQFTNCIFNNNQFVVASSSFYAMANIQYSIVEQVDFATGSNIMADPQFIDTLSSNFQLQPCSPAINSGTATNAPLVDLLNNVRPFPGGTINMGAYEFQGARGLKLYVNLLASGLNNGEDWVNAFNDLQNAIAIACEGSVIWVAASPDSAYLPTQTTDRNIAFIIPNGVKIYGGFAGSELANYDISLRNFVTNETILSGNIGTQNDSLDNSHHVVRTEDVNAETLLDGFTITEGHDESSIGGGGWYNDGSFSLGSTPSIRYCKFEKNYATQGGGLKNYGSNGLSNPILTYCTFLNNRGNTGAAVYNYGDGSTSQSSPEFMNCSFIGNEASANGGAVFNLGGSSSGNSSPSFTTCTFTENKASFGGGVYSYGYGGNSNSVFSKCIFTSNESSSSGGALYNTGGSGGHGNPIIDSCTFMSNIANSGGAIYNDGGYSGNSEVSITTCTFTSNMATMAGGAINNSAYSGVLKSKIKDCIFENNSAQRGGGIYINADQGVVFDTLSNSAFTMNTANYGGGIYTRNTNGSLNSWRENNVFNSNGSSHLGFEGTNTADLPSFVNCTFYGATSYLIDLTNGFNPSNTLNFTNSISRNNAANLVSGSAANDAKILVKYSIVDEASFVPGDNNSLQNPLFTDVGNNDFSLKCNSPAIDLGTLTGAPLKDIVGFTRTGNPDVGAFEYQVPLAVNLSNIIPNGTNTNHDGVPSVTASSLIQNTNNILFRATGYILLNQGFEIAPTGGGASVFLAEIGGWCL